MLKRAHPINLQVRSNLRSPCPNQIESSGGALIVQLMSQGETLLRRRGQRLILTLTRVEALPPLACQMQSSMNKVYEKDNENVHKVRAKILGLSEESRPSREAIDSSPIFALRRAADETRAPDIIGEHWIPYLEEMGLLADCPPRDLPSLEGWLPLYMRDGIRKHLGIGQVLKKEKSCPLIAEMRRELQSSLNSTRPSVSIGCPFTRTPTLENRSHSAPTVGL